MCANNKTFELPFGIDFVISEDLSREPGFESRKASGSSYDINCPFCGGKRKMNINTAKNVAKCNKCGGGSGYNTITLHGALTGLSNSESYRDLLRRWNGLESDAKLLLCNLGDNEEPSVKPAPIEIRDLVYRSFLNELTLSKKHKDDLKRRGLSDKQIEEGLYRTVPAVGFHTLAYNAVFGTSAYLKLTGHKLWGIPGFVNVENPNKVSCRGRKSGYFVPVIQKDGLISGMQIRYDSLPEDASSEEKENFKKYSWYSSSEKETGCSVTGCENIHFAGNWKEIPKAVNLTEGVLKADVASALSDKPFLGLVGVNNISQLSRLLSQLQMLGTESVNIYVDMDYRTKPEVAAALLGIKREINKSGVHDYAVTAKSCESYSLYAFDNRNLDTKGFKRGLRLTADREMPKSVMVFIDRAKIPSEKVFCNKNIIEIEHEYISMVRNSSHTLRIVDTSHGFDNYSELSVEKRQLLLKNALIGEVTFEKTGLTYREMNWNDKYKGIDDYYLYLRSLSGKGDL